MNSSPIFPEAFTSRMQKQLGDEYPAFIASLSHEPATSIRWNPLKTPKAHSLQRPVPWCALGEYLESHPVFIKDPRFHAGAYYVQEASSMFTEQLISASDFDRPVIALDLCASPGGKSTHLLSLLPPGSLLVANETIRNRLGALEETITRWGHANVMITQNDPEDFRALEGFFDLILVDAPCSGEGLFRKDQLALREWSPVHIEHCALRQQRILEPAWAALKEEGVLLYSTCTYNEMENESQLEWLYRHHPYEPFRVSLAKEWKLAEVNHRNYTSYRFYPHRAMGEGFVITAVRKKESASAIVTKRRQEREILLKKETAAQLREWITSAEPMMLEQQLDRVNAFPESLEAAVREVEGALRVKQKGTAVAVLKQGKPVPAHGLALSPMVSNLFPSFEIDLDMAIRYLRKETLPLENSHRGYARIRYQDWSLGWVNAIGSRMNNLYPKNQRILMR